MDAVPQPPQRESAKRAQWRETWEKDDSDVEWTPDLPSNFVRRRGPSPTKRAKRTTRRPSQTMSTPAPGHELAMQANDGTAAAGEVAVEVAGRLTAAEPSDEQPDLFARAAKNHSLVSAAAHLMAMDRAYVRVELRDTNEVFVSRLTPEGTRQLLVCLTGQRDKTHNNICLHEKGPYRRAKVLRGRTRHARRIGALLANGTLEYVRAHDASVVVGDGMERYRTDVVRVCRASLEPWRQTAVCLFAPFCIYER